MVNTYVFSSTFIHSFIFSAFLRSNSQDQVQGKRKLKGWIQKVSQSLTGQEALEPTEGSRFLSPRRVPPLSITGENFCKVPLAAWPNLPKEDHSCLHLHLHLHLLKFHQSEKTKLISQEERSKSVNTFGLTLVKHHCLFFWANSFALKMILNIPQYCLHLHFPLPYEEDI